MPELEQHSGCQHAVGITPDDLEALNVFRWITSTVPSLLTRISSFLIMHDTRSADPFQEPRRFISFRWDIGTRCLQASCKRLMQSVYLLSSFGNFLQCS